jgi:hypothetical protein
MPQDQLKIMEPEKKNFFEETKELVTKYLDDQLLLIKLQRCRKSSKSICSMVKVIVVAVLAYFIHDCDLMLGSVCQLTDNYYIASNSCSDLFG